MFTPYLTDIGHFFLALHNHFPCFLGTTLHELLFYLFMSIERNGIRNSGWCGFFFFSLVWYGFRSSWMGFHRDILWTRMVFVVPFL